MVIFQIRTVSDRSFNTVFQEMVDYALDAFEKSEYPAKPDDIANLLRHKLDPFVKTYNVCGTSTVCSDEVEGAPWLDYSDQIYLLEIPDTLKIFFKELASGLVNEMEVADVDKATKLEARLEKMFRKALLSHLYYNSICGNHEVCKTRTPLSPWSA